MNRADQRVLCILSNAGATTAELESLERLWLEDRRADEPLVQYLVRRRILTEHAPGVLAMNWGDDLLRGGTEDLIQPHGVELLRGLIAPGPQLAVDRATPLHGVPIRGLVLPAGAASTTETPITRKSKPPMTTPTVDPPPRPDNAACNFTSGQLLGRCLITGRIAEGSYGVVYRALHRTLNIPVAVKVLHPELLEGESKAVQQFRTEAMLLARLNHPNIVRLWDFDDTVSPPYLVLEYIQGASVADLIQRRGPLTLPLSLRIILQAIDGLEAARQVGIVHRDVKPANLLLTRDERAKIADLGLAAVANRGRHAGPGDGAPMAGTVAYLAPEQANNPGLLDHRSDIYSLGATFYHMITGRLPFSGRSSLEVLMKHANEPVPPPQSVVPRLDRGVCDVILRMMAKNPADRFRSYDDLRDALIEADIARQSAASGLDDRPPR
jgi:hypothetical protein